MRDKKRWNKVLTGILAATIAMSIPVQSLYADDFVFGSSSTDGYVDEGYYEEPEVPEVDAQAEADRIAAEQAEAERIAAEQAEAERIAAEQAEAERIAAEQAEAERIAAEQAEAERIAAEQAEAERIAAEQAEAERIAAEQAEADRIAAEQAEADRIAAEKAEAQRIAAEQAEIQKLEAERQVQTGEAPKAEGGAAGQQDDEQRFLLDLETEADWMATLPGDLRHKMTTAPTEADYRADIVAIANSQKGYKESEKNYIENEDGSTSAYSRYGTWYGDSYVNPWDSVFACFVLYYAGVPNVPYDADTVSWTYKLADKNMYFDTAYAPEIGDLVFLKEADGRIHVAIITSFTEENRIVAVEGTIAAGRKEVKEVVLDRADGRIFAYASVVPADPEPVEEEVPEEAEEELVEGEPEEQTEEPEEQAAEQILIEQSLDAAVYTDDTKAAVLENIAVSISGNLPENATVAAWPVVVEVDGEETYGAYQIVILDADGNEYHSTAEDGQVYNITIHDAKLVELLAKSEDAHGWHQREDEEKENLSFTLTEDGSVQFASYEI